MRGRKPKPTALKRLDGNPGKRGYNQAEPVLPEGLPDCPGHLAEPAREDWHRIAGTLHEAGVLTTVDRAALAAYCQAWGRWVEAEEKLQDTPAMIKTPSGYVQQNPWLPVANKQLDIMGRYMAELGITPASRSRIQAGPIVPQDRIDRIERVIVSFRAPDDRDEAGTERVRETRPFPLVRAKAAEAEIVLRDDRGT
jgi:P27 family predicted phage terminase small subunit